MKIFQKAFKLVNFRSYTRMKKENDLKGENYKKITLH